MDKKIAFFLPGKEKVPSGGYKVVYEYANRIAKDGCDVRIIYPLIEAKEDTKKNIFFRIKRFVGFYYRRRRGQFAAGEWFALDPAVKKTFVYKFTDRYVRKYRNYKIICTAISTAYELNSVKSIPNENKYYFIQDFEAWKNVTEDMVYDSYRFPMKKITIAPWLVARVNSVGQSAKLVPNGFDFEYFKLTVPIESRKNSEIAMLYHLDDRKRCADSMAALELVKKEIPDLHVTMFGTPPRPDDLPEWYTYFRMPDKETHNTIYNNAAIFVAASKAEGMALPPAEAMICGAALCCTDIGGFSLYAKHEKTALLSPVYDVRALADNILRLIRDDELRLRIAKTGNEYIRQFTWEKAFSLFKEALENNG